MFFDLRLPAVPFWSVERSETGARRNKREETLRSFAPVFSRSAIPRDLDYPERDCLQSTLIFDPLTFGFCLIPPAEGEIFCKEQYGVCQHIRNQHMTEDEVVVSFDVVALFTSIPVEMALQVTRELLQQDVTLSQRTNISITNVMKLLEFVLKNSNFSYDQEHYQQTFGCGMGSPVGATVANTNTSISILITPRSIRDQWLILSSTEPRTSRRQEQDNVERGNTLSTS